MPLRYYQEDARDAVLFGWEEYDRILLHLGTGGGKTVIAAHLIEQLLPNRVLFLADQDELCRQPLEVIEREIGIVAALDKAKSQASFKSKVVVGSSQTLSKKARLERYPPDFFQYIIIDEAHRGSDRDQKIADYFNCKVLGITATPFRANLRDLTRYYAHTAFSMPMLDLIGEGFAPPMKVVTIPIEIDLEEVATKRGFDGKDYEAESLSTTIAPYYEKIIDELAEYSDRFMLVRLPLIRASKDFAHMARLKGIRAVHVDGTSEDRIEIIEGFRQGRYNMLCNANLIEVGVDIPNADCAVNLSPTYSAGKYQQFIGRVMRVLPGTIDHRPERENAQIRRELIAKSKKPDSLVIDFLWQHDRLGSQSPANLIAQNDEEAALIRKKLAQQHTAEELQEIAKRVMEEREASLVKTLEKAAIKATKRLVEPKVFGMLINSREIMNYEASNNWEAKSASPVQIEKLTKWGIDCTDLDMGLARKLMNHMMHRFRYRLATIGQLMAIQRLNLKVDTNILTISQASQLISETKLNALRNAPEALPI